MAAGSSSGRLPRSRRGGRRRRRWPRRRARWAWGGCGRRRGRLGRRRAWCRGPRRDRERKRGRRALRRTR
ncbi:MAG: hypothetical protein E6I51_03485 [Chloroflexi bacterium]|nr:MAG: hypothetical protein E6I51_03485 [Chloroflexota bacterium]